jgi:hypothetical protein
VRVHLKTRRTDTTLVAMAATAGTIGAVVGLVDVFATAF